MSNKMLLDKKKITLHNETAGINCLSQICLTYKVRISGTFDSRKDSHPTQLERRPYILVKLSFRELWDSKLPGLPSFHNTTKSMSQKRGKNQIGMLWVHETLILEVIFVKNSFIVKHKKWHQETSWINTPPDIVVGIHFCAQHSTKTALVFLLANAEASSYFQVWYFYYQTALCN